MDSRLSADEGVIDALFDRRSIRGAANNVQSRPVETHPRIDNRLKRAGRFPIDIRPCEGEEENRKPLGTPYVRATLSVSSYLNCLPPPFRKAAYLSSNERDEERERAIACAEYF